MIRFDVQLNNIHETILTQEVETCRRVEVILMLGRLFWLWLKQELPLETDRLRMLVSHVHEASQMVQFAFHVSIVRAHVAFATAPEYIVLATQFIGNFESLLNLSTSVSKHICIRACCRSVHVPRM